MQLYIELLQYARQQDALKHILPSSLSLGELELIQELRKYRNKVKINKGGYLRVVERTLE